MWYVIQTVTGKEEELMLFIRNILCRERYESCFVIYAQWMKRLGGEWQIQVRPLFPGYVFIDTEEPERLYMDPVSYTHLYPGDAGFPRSPGRG